jgi:hypothetical protein
MSRARRDGKRIGRPRTSTVLLHAAADLVAAGVHVGRGRPTEGRQPRQPAQVDGRKGRPWRRQESPEVMATEGRLEAMAGTGRFRPPT